MRFQEYFYLFFKIIQKASFVVKGVGGRQAVKDGALTFVAVPAYGKMGLPVILLFPCRFGAMRFCRTSLPPIHRFPEHRHPFGNAHFPGLHCAPLYAPPPSLPAVRLTSNSFQVHVTCRELCTLRSNSAQNARNVHGLVHVTSSGRKM